MKLGHLNTVILDHLKSIKGTRSCFTLSSDKKIITDTDTTDSTILPIFPRTAKIRIICNPKKKGIMEPLEAKKLIHYVNFHFSERTKSILFFALRAAIYVVGPSYFRNHRI
jgi:hypothetical protein